MTTIPLLWAAAAAPTFTAVWLAVHQPMRSWRRVAIAGLGAAALAVTAFGITEALGRPKPVGMEMLHSAGDGDAELLGVRVVPDVEIFVWVLLPGETEPRAFVLPWNSDQAEQLQKAMAEGNGENGNGAAMRMPFDGGNDPSDMMAWPLPQPARPEKVYAE